MVGGGYKCLMVVVVGVLAVIQLQGEVALASKHEVGGSQGWDESTDFNSWASGETFKVGDELVFKYSSGLHSVVELADEKAYKSCDVGSSSLKTMNSGSDVVKLDKPGTRYFACGTSGHCDAGMKLKVQVAAAGAAGSSSSSSPPSTSSSSASSSVHHHNLLVAAASLMIAEIFFFVFPIMS